MAFGTNTLSSTDVALKDADKPMLVGENHVRDATDLRWTTGGTTASSDLTDSDGPAAFAGDDAQAGQTYGNGNQATWYFNVDFGSDVDFDVVAVLNHNFFTRGKTMTIEAASSADSAFGSATTVYAAAAVASNRRFLDITVAGGDNQIVEARYLRIKLTGASNVPKFGELIVGRRRQLKHNPRNGYDPNNLRSRVDTFEAADGSPTVYVRYKGRQHLNAIFDPHETTYISRIETFYEDDTAFGTEPFLYLYEPATDEQNAPFMRMNPPDLNGPGDGPSQRVFQVSAVEVGPVFNKAEY